MTRDSSFDSDGRLQIFPSGLAGYYEIFSRDSASDVTVDQQGRIVIVGSAQGKLGIEHSEALVVRFMPDGTLDGSFSGDGIIHFEWEPEHSTASAVAIDHQGRIVVGGTTSKYPSSGIPAVARFLPDGDPDPTFSEDGKAIANVDGTGTSLAIDTQDRVLITAYAYFNGSLFGTTRFTEHGDVDNSFGGDGLVLTDFPGAQSATSAAVAIDASGRPVVVGSADFPHNSSLAVARYTEEGGLDLSFDEDGRALLDFGNLSWENAQEVVFDQDGRIVIVGQAETIGDYATDYVGDFLVLVGRILPDGTPDRSFDGDGRSVVARSEQIYAENAAIDSAGRIVVAGSIGGGQSPAGFGSWYQVSEAFLLRYGADGTLEEDIGPEALLREDFLAPYVNTTSVAIDQQGRYVLAGSLGTEPFFGGPGFVGLARYLVDYPPAATVPQQQPPPALPRCLGEEASIVGTEARDLLRGTRGKDVIVGLGGDDRIRASSGKDLVCAGAGADNVKAGAGDDVISGEAGRDRLFGEGGDDRLSGGAGLDRFICGAGRDVSSGGPRDRFDGCERVIEPKARR